MPCDSNPNLTPVQKADQVSALARLERGLALGTVTVKIGASGAIAFAGWKDNAGLADVCAYRRLTAGNSPALRRAIARAEVTSGRKVNAQAIAAGVHSHDGGRSWGTH